MGLDERGNVAFVILWESFKLWCSHHAHDNSPTIQIFSRMLWRNTNASEIKGAPKGFSLR
jgi:hypothetical protein